MPGSCCSALHHCCKFFVSCFQLKLCHGIKTITILGMTTLATKNLIKGKSWLFNISAYIYIYIYIYIFIHTHKHITGSILVLIHNKRVHYWCCWYKLSPYSLNLVSFVQVHKKQIKITTYMITVIKCHCFTIRWVG